MAVVDGVAAGVGVAVAGRLRALRLERGWSIRELARRSQLAPESVSRSERAVTEVTITNLEKLCRGLGITVSEFFEGLEPPRTQPGATRSRLPEWSRLEQVLHAMPSTRRRKFIEAVTILVEVESSRSR
jgi:transcriptional regulator with XRE-family HTH domain